MNTSSTEKYTGLVGYWPEAFVALLEGTAPEDETEFKQVVGKLISHRKNGNPYTT